MQKEYYFRKICFPLLLSCILLVSVGLETAFCGGVRGRTEQLNRLMSDQLIQRQFERSGIPKEKREEIFRKFYESPGFREFNQSNQQPSIVAIQKALGIFLEKAPLAPPYSETYSLRKGRQRPEFREKIEKIAKLRSSYVSKFDNIDLSAKGKKIAVDFASSFFANHYDQKINNSILVYVGVKESSGLKEFFGNQQYEIAIFTTEQAIIPIESKQEKTNPLTARNYDEWLHYAGEKIGQINQDKSANIFVYGDGVPGVSFNEFFGDTGLPIFRISNSSKSYADQLGVKIKNYCSRLAELKPSNTIICNGLPTNETELKNIGKDIKNRDIWLDAAKDFNEKCAEKNIQNVKGNKEVLKKAFAEDNNVIVIVADAKKNYIDWPANSFLSIEDIKSLKEIVKNREKPPLAIIITCKAASSFEIGTVGEIISKLCDEGVISGAIAPVDYVRPDTIFKTINHFIENRSPLDSNPQYNKWQNIVLIRTNMSFIGRIIC